MDRLAYVWLAYSITWLVIFGYTLVLGQRQKNIDREITQLKEAVAEKRSR